MTLPNTEPLAHRNVATSQEAARSLPQFVLRAQHLRMLRAYHASTKGLTNDEMEWATGMRPPTITPRRLELEEAGLIQNVNDERRPTRAGRSAYVWRITEAGEEALESELDTDE